LRRATGSNFAGAVGGYGAPRGDRRICGRDHGRIRAGLVSLYQRFFDHYIAEHSNRALPGAYKFSALWSGQEGSLLLWAWLLGTYGFVLRLTHKTDVKLYAYAGTILAGIQVFFLAVLCFAAPPFSCCGAPFPTMETG